jgi:hypothetical protein
MLVLMRIYSVCLRLYPRSFRARHTPDMLLDFEDGLRTAAVKGWRPALGFVARAFGDIGMSLLREWLTGARLIRFALTAAITLALWSAALRPWRFDDVRVQPGPPVNVQVRSVEAIELLVLAVLALVPVVTVILFSNHLVRPRRSRLRD